MSQAFSAAWLIPVLRADPSLCWRDRYGQQYWDRKKPLVRLAERADSKSTAGFPNRGEVCLFEQQVAADTWDKRLNPITSGRRGWKSHGLSASEPEFSVGCFRRQLAVSNTQSLQPVCSHKCSRDLRWSEARKQSKTTAVIKNSGLKSSKIMLWHYCLWSAQTELDRNKGRDVTHNSRWRR